MLEEKSENLLTEGIKRRGGLALKLKFVGLAGAPDRLVLLPGGRFFLVELKKIGGELEASQRLVFPKLAARGQQVHVIEGHPGVEKFMRYIDGNEAKPVADGPCCWYR